MLLRSAYVLLLLSLFSQSASSQLPSPTPEKIKLLPGYTTTQMTGKDAETTRIVRGDGFAITHVSPAVRGFYERSNKSRSDIVWLKNQTIHGHKIAVTWVKNGEMLVIVDDTQMFRARPVELDHVADLLLTVGTLFQKAVEYPSTASTGINPPGNILLLPGYTYVRRKGIDSHVGSIVGQSGLTINHDIGGMASNYSREYFPEHFEQLREQKPLSISKDAIESQIRYLQQQVSWRVRQEVNGDELMIVYFKDSKLTASFDRSTANFIAKVDSFEQITDFLLTVLTYQPKQSNRLPK